MPRIRFRNELVSLLLDHFGERTDCRVLYENGPLVDMNESTVPVISCEISYTDAEQAELSETPLIRDTGSILITVLVKSSSGNLKALALRDEVAQLLQRKNLAGADLKVAKLLPNSSTVKGWVGYRSAVPFWHYHH